MGPALSALRGLFSLKRDVRIVVLGLDAAGKTTFANKLKLGEVVSTIPTIGFNVESVEYKSLKMTLWDVGGQKRLRGLWSYYFEHVDAIIWVVDSADRERLKESMEELSAVVGHELLERATLLVYANKQDMPGAASPSQVAEALKLQQQCPRRKFWVQGSSFTTGNGVFEGLEWMSNNLPPKKA